MPASISPWCSTPNGAAAGQQDGQQTGCAPIPGKDSARLLGTSKRSRKALSVTLPRTGPKEARASALHERSTHAQRQSETASESAQTANAVLPLQVIYAAANGGLNDVQPARAAAIVHHGCRGSPPIVTLITGLIKIELADCQDLSI